MVCYFCCCPLSQISSLATAVCCFVSSSGHWPIGLEGFLHGLPLSSSVARQSSVGSIELGWVLRRLAGWLAVIAFAFLSAFTATARHTTLGWSRCFRRWFIFIISLLLIFAIFCWPLYCLLCHCCLSLLHFFLACCPPSLSWLNGFGGNIFH